MSILDDAIREHLELKRAHGADEAELKKLEDEAFGPPGRPDDHDPLAEAPTEFLGTPAIDAQEAAEEAQGRRVPNIADLQEAPPSAPDTEEEPSLEHQTIPVPHPEPPSEPEPESTEEPAPVADSGHSTEERHAIADQPTEFFDVEAEMVAGAEQPSPTDEQLLDSQLAEPRLAPSEATPAEPFEAIRDTGPDAEVAHEPLADEEDDDFFSEQRLSDELNQALEAPVTDEHEVFAQPTPTDEHEVAPPPPPPPREEEETAIYNVEEASGEEEDSGEHESDGDVYEPETGSHDDVLEDTPEFLEEAPEDDDLWFEQKPPKDFDLD
ncbi:MAG TPA: hypothetical protein VLL27_11890 [Solirubrobacterales bacterium]|nr:hypothetical protein [Solirubrobacterales bacterium]